MGFTKKLAGAWEMLKDELLYEPPVPSSPTQAPPPALLDTTTAVGHALTGLHTQHRQVSQHVERLAQTERTTADHGATIAALRRLVLEMAPAFERAQATHSQLSQALHDKRLLLATREQTLTQATQQELHLRQTLGTLQQEKAQEAGTLRQLRDTVATLEADLSQSQAAYRTLTEQHDALVGTYHQLFLASQKTAQASGHTSAAPAA